MVKKTFKSIKNRFSSSSEAKNARTSPANASSSKSTDSIEEFTLTTKSQFIEEHLPTFRECPVFERSVLLLKKLRLCCVVFDFNNDSHTENLGKEMKRQLLLELVDHISTSKNWFSENALIEIVRMVEFNLFRPFAPSPNDNITDPEDEEPILDPSWPHLQIVYELLLRVVLSSDTDAKVMKAYITPDFVLCLLRLFNSEDPRERDYLKTIIHRIYGKFMSLRLFIRKSIQNIFYEFIYDTERHFGIGEILEILGSIINGFALPIKSEHVKFLKNALLPLHKAKMLPLFHQQLAYCVTQFTDKDPKLAPYVICGLLSYWPVVNSSKEVLFLNELEEILELTQAEQFQAVAVPLFKQISLSIGSAHFQVAERALFLFNNDYIAGLATDHVQVVLPILYPILHKNSKKHWNSTVHNLSFNVIQLFMQRNEEYFEEVSKAYTDSFKEEEVLKAERAERWEKVKAMAAKSR